MSTATTFAFADFTISDSRREVFFDYCVSFSDDRSLNFQEKILFPVDLPDLPVIVKLLQALHIGLGISYYKAFLPPKFELEQPLSTKEAAFWNTTYLHGLGEFLYTNQLDPSRLASFQASTPIDEPVAVEATDGVILALGGGKDSIVAGELLKQLGLNITAYVLGTGKDKGQTPAVAKDMSVELLAIERTLDPVILEVNKRPDVYNGHVPISMIFALCGLLLCAATSKRYLVVANEASASIPNTQWKGIQINHQWSKSFTFEQDFQAFVQTTISPDLWYFSAIRPLGSVAVAKLFAEFPQYFSDFTSCNLVFRIDPAKRPNGRWCGQCPKCLSSFIILSPWIPETKLVELFGKNMLADESLRVLFQELTGQSGHKPLDCVGTTEELLLSLNLAYAHGYYHDAALMQQALDKKLVAEDDQTDALADAISLGNEHAFPDALQSSLGEKLKQVLKV